MDALGRADLSQSTAETTIPITGQNYGHMQCVTLGPHLSIWTPALQGHPVSLDPEFQDRRSSGEKEHDVGASCFAGD